MNVFAEWCDLAAGLTEYTPTTPEAAQSSPRRERNPNDSYPGDDFNRRGTWEETGLFAVGWTLVRMFDGERGHVRRPGKSEGISGTIGVVTSREHGWSLLYVFTTNGHPFEANGSYDRFGVFARLKHRGDFQAAARALGSMGYGQRDGRATFGLAPSASGVPAA